MIEIKIGDCTERLQDLEDNSVDSIICDPPYGIKVLDKDWDDLGEGSQQRNWHRKWLTEAHRVLKKGGLIKAFSGAKTYHHLIATMEEIGFSELRIEAWVYTSGMPAGNYDVAKGVESQILFGDSNKKFFKKLKGSRREGKVGYSKIFLEHGLRPKDYQVYGVAFDLEPQTEEGELYMGYGTTLKKAWEPICIGVKK